jgi:nucleotide-binding universal stress UspA family protein
MSSPIRTIVAGVANVHEPDSIVAPAIALAEATGAALHFVYAFDLPDPLLSAYARDGLLGRDFGARYRDDLQRRMEEHVRERTVSERVTCHALSGNASEVLCAHAKALEADLVIVGATRSGKLFRSILGSTAERVVRTANLPVLVIRNPSVESVHRVLLTTDLSDFSARIHDDGLDLVEALYPQVQPELRSLLVVWYDVAFPPPLRRNSLQGVARAELVEFLQERKPRDSSVTPRVRIGDPAKEITAETIEWGADLLVLGTHSRSGRSRLLLGSVAEATVRGTTTNVLVLPPVAGAQTPAAAEEAAVAAS